MESLIYILNSSLRNLTVYEVYSGMMQQIRNVGAETYLKFLITKLKLRACKGLLTGKGHGGLQRRLIVVVVGAGIDSPLKNWGATPLIHGKLLIDFTRNM